MVKKRLRLVGNIVSYVVLSALVLMIAFVFVSNMSGKPIFVANRSVLWVLTGSMEPTIPEKSYILIERVPVDEIAVGDVIVFVSDDDRIRGAKNTHRVVEIVGDHEAFVTKGDNNPTVDSVQARADSVIGVYRRTLPFLSRIGRFLATGIGLSLSCLLIVLMLTLLFVPDMIRITREWNAELARRKQEAWDARLQQEVERLRQEESDRKDDDHV